MVVHVVVGVVVIGWWATNVDGGGAWFIAWALVCCVTWHSRVVLAALQRAVIIEGGPCAKFDFSGIPGIAPDSAGFPQESVEDNKDLLELLKMLPMRQKLVFFSVTTADLLTIWRWPNAILSNILLLESRNIKVSRSLTGKLFTAMMAVLRKGTLNPALLVFFTEVTSFTCTFRVFWSVASDAAATGAFFDARGGFGFTAKVDTFDAADAILAAATDAFVHALGAMVKWDENELTTSPSMSPVT
ncbi:uncharacterized protein LACBIDRAFT_331934 [Laccaria bicolor S238N-H82]|uniref:Predicted protein n=1 Tax=Laccaria bicolor (strain S238N-H82 / ATCC MYA-4686) TaxID=486041 RepID=B0DR33_LACBS|nr:uncharacterized protein LACBIDRAFT_331934 [Laccaria bicolor S238N-H82]EDR02927.1 predicted protein [Laccaria bicolor S238N-H82]|eukprot:XP_001886350.1 predicted protein [Laccaria bicolor S238N-H82]